MLLTDGELCLVAATAFTSEFLLFSYHSATDTGLEGYYHHLLLILTTILGELPADDAAGTLIEQQGMWLYQTALTLYGPMLPDGCARNAKGNQVDCSSRAAEERAEQLANFLAFIYVLGCYVVAAARYGHPDLVAMHGKHIAAMEGRGVGCE